MPEKVEKRGDKGCNVGPGGGAEDFFNGGEFGPWGDEFHFGEDLQCPAGGIEFNRQREEVEQHDHTPTCHHDHEISLGMKSPEAGEKSEEGKPSHDLTCEGRGTDRSHPPLQGGVGDLVLDGVPALVGGHSESRGRVAMEIFRGENKPFVHRIIMVTQQTVLLDDFHIPNPRCIQNAGGGFRSSEPRGGGDFTSFGVRDFYPGGGPEGKRHRSKEG